MKRAKPKPARVLANPAHELGMGFLVSAIVLAAVELTMHMAHARHIEEKVAENVKLYEIRNELTSIARALGKRPSMPVSQAEYNMAIDACDPLDAPSRYQERVRPVEDDLAGSICRIWLRRGKYKEAETEFQKALEFDRDRGARGVIGI